jgi:hypothetical protein
MVAAWLAAEPSAFWELLALRLRRLWQGLLIASVGGFVLVAIPGWVVTKLGADPSPIFTDARYAWIVLAWIAVGVSLAWGGRDAAALDSSRRRVRRRPLAGALGFIPLFAFVLIVGRLFITDEQVGLSLPYRIGDFFFDAFTTDLASDECLAFRAVDDGRSYWPWYPGDSAAARLLAHGDRGLPGLESYIENRLPASDEPSGRPRGISVGILALLATYGDHWLLQRFERYPEYQTARMRRCIQSGHRVQWSYRGTWKCGS